MLTSIFIETGPASGGWTVYPPLSALPQAMPGSGLGMTMWLVSMALFIVSSLLGSLNYIVTVINLPSIFSDIKMLFLIQKNIPTPWAF